METQPNEQFDFKANLVENGAESKLLAEVNAERKNQDARDQKAPANGGAQTQEMEGAMKAPAPSEIAKWHQLLGAKMLRNSEMVVDPEVPGNYKLPGDCTLNVSGRGKESGMSLTYTDPKIKTPGPHETVQVKADGTISTSSIFGNRNFKISQDGNDTLVRTPSGDKVVIRDGRIVETVNSSGQKTEFLTPSEANGRHVEREAQLEASIKATAKGIAQSIVDGNIPVKELSKSFNEAQAGLLGKEGTVRLARAINAQLKLQGSETRIDVFESPKSGATEVRVRTPQGTTYLDITPIASWKKRW